LFKSIYLRVQYMILSQF